MEKKFKTFFDQVSRKQLVDEGSLDVFEWRLKLSNFLFLYLKCVILNTKLLYKDCLHI